MPVRGFTPSSSLAREVSTVLAPALRPALMKLSLSLRLVCSSLSAAVAARSSSGLPGTWVKVSSVTRASSTTKSTVRSRRLVWCRCSST